MDIAIANLSKAYGEKQVLRNLSLTLEPGRLYVLTGASGTGKTTLLHILLGLVKPDAGTVPQGISYSMVFQENRLLPRRSPIQNLLPVCPDKQRVTAFLEEILPRDCLDKKIETLSGGMQRRVAIARAMIAPSQAVCMDEPFTGLDAGTADAVIQFILRHQQGRLLLIATHQEELLAGYDPEVIQLPNHTR